MSQSNYEFLKDLDLSEDVVGRLSHLLDGTVEGSTDIYMTPLGQDNDPDSLLKELDAIFESNSPDITPELNDLEQNNRSKFGPRSIAIPWEERRSLVSDYFGSDDNFGIEQTSPAVSSRLRPLSVANAMKFLKNDTNSGLPYFMRKGKIKEDVLANFDQLLERKDPCIMFTRTQESHKTRAVWGYPIADTLNEMRYYRPILEVQKQQPWRAAINAPDVVDKRITELINNAQSSNESLVSIDFSSYDATLRSSLQSASFQYFKSMFQAGHDGLDYIENRFNMIGLITPEGVWNGPHGVPSGSTFTNEVDSVAQYLIAATSPSKLLDFQIQGDDGAYRTENPDQLKELFTNYGLIVNDEKSYVSDKHIVYLQNLHSVDYVRNGMYCGIYPLYRALNRLVYQERFDNFSEYDIKGSDFYSIRTIAILENCRNHPLFKDFVKFIQSKDKYGLMPSQQGITNYVKMVTGKAGAEGIIQHQYGDQIRGIRSFETFKILSES
jgi:hypothetical protein